MTMREKIAEIINEGELLLSYHGIADAIIAALPDYDAQQKRITELERELRHCIYELDRDDSRKPHRVRRAALARAVLKGEEA